MSVCLRSFVRLLLFCFFQYNAFQIMARACIAVNRRDDAIEALKQSVKLDNPSDWQLLVELTAQEKAAKKASESDIQQAHKHVHYTSQPRWFGTKIGLGKTHLCALSGDFAFLWRCACCLSQCSTGRRLCAARCVWANASFPGGCEARGKMISCCCFPFFKNPPKKKSKKIEILC